MTSFSPQCPKEDNPGISIQEADSEDHMNNTSGRIPVIRELFNHQSRITSLRRYLLRIITVIIIASVAVGVYELLN